MKSRTRHAADRLRTHGRYDYSNITARPDYSWPDGRRLAVYVALNIEGFRFGKGKGAAIAPPDQAQSHSVVQLARLRQPRRDLAAASSCSTSSACRPRRR